MEFPDHESAQRSSNHPATAAFAEELAKITDGRPEYRDLDVRRARPY